MCIKHKLKILCPLLIFLPLLTFSLSGHPQEGGAEVGGGAEGGADAEMGIEGELDLDYSDEEAIVFDIDEYTTKESTLQIAETTKPKGIGLIHEAAKAKTSISLGGDVEVMAPAVPEYYVVQKGDTLFYLSEYFFANPELWPGIWALNPEITNPNWIYPGQALLLAPAKEKVEDGEVKAVVPEFISYAFWKKGTEYIRPLGFIDKDIEEETGKIIGSFEETMYLDMYHTLYIKYKKGKAPKVGSKSTVYEIEGTVQDNEKRKIKYGKLVRILGMVKIVDVDKDHKLAKGVIIEAARPIERGDLIGPVKWKFKTTEPVKAKLDLEGKVIAPLEDVEYSGKFDIVFVNLGKEDGLAEGNIMKVKRKKDHYMEVIGKKDKSKYFWWEEIGKAMVIESLKETATCIIIESSRDLKVGDKVELKRGE